MALNSASNPLLREPINKSPDNEAAATQPQPYSRATMHKSRGGVRILRWCIHLYKAYRIGRTSIPPPPASFARFTHNYTCNDEKQKLIVENIFLTTAAVCSRRHSPPTHVAKHEKEEEREEKRKYSGEVEGVAARIARETNTHCTDKRVCRLYLCIYIYEFVLMNERRRERINMRDRRSMARIYICTHTCGESIKRAPAGGRAERERERVTAAARRAQEGAKVSAAASLLAEERQSRGMRRNVRTAAATALWLLDPLASFLWLYSEPPALFFISLSRRYTKLLLLLLYANRCCVTLVYFAFCVRFFFRVVHESLDKAVERDFFTTYCTKSRKAITWCTEAFLSSANTLTHALFSYERVVYVERSSIATRRKPRSSAERKKVSEALIYGPSLLR